MANKPCAICGGAESEHVTSQHVFTLVEGELVTKAEQRKAEQQSMPAPQLNPGPMGRLLEVLAVKGIINIAEVIYISDLGPRPDNFTKEPN